MVITTTYLKARKWPLIFVYLFVAFPFLLVKLLSDANDPKMNFYIAFIIFTHLLVFFLWFALSKLEIQIYPDALAYRTLFFRKEVNWNEITDIKLDVGFAGQHPHLKWIFFAGRKSISIHPSYFSRINNRFLAEAAIE